LNTIEKGCLKRETAFFLLIFFLGVEYEKQLHPSGQFSPIKNYIV
jgi:hypothetical protein